MYATTREFVQALEKAGELARIKPRVSPILEITELADRQSKSPAPHPPSEATRRTDPRFHDRGGKALLFENVEGSDIPVLINQFGSYFRVEVALGCNTAAPGGIKPGHTSQTPDAPGGLEGLAARIGALAKPEPPITLIDKLKKIPELLELARLPPRVVKHGICQEVVLTGDQIDLKRLPLIRCWPLDGDLAAVGHPADANDAIPGVESGPEWNARFRGRYITLGGIHTIHRDDLGHASPPSRNIGMYRVQLLGKRHMAMHWHMHHDGARHWRSWRARGEKMPVAIALGGESVLPYAATAPMPPGMSELLLAGFLNRGPIPLVRCRTVPIDVPANSEIVIEGLVDTEPSVLEGPFGDHTGFYSLPDRYPLLEVTAITHRRDPIYPTTVVGLPPQEDYFLGKATERLFLPLLRTVIPDIIDYDLPMFGAFHNCAIVKVKKAYPLQGRRVMHSVWGAGQMAWTKTVIVVDDDVDVHDTMSVMRTVAERCHPARDVELVRGPIDILDHATPFLGAGTKMGLDATRKAGEAEAHRHLEGAAAELCATSPITAALGEPARATERRVRRIPGVLDAIVPEQLAGLWLLAKIDKKVAGDGLRAIKAIGGIAEEVALPPWTIIVGPDADLGSLDDAFFHWLANMSPERDRQTSVCGRRIAFDATPKMPGDEVGGWPVRQWPPIIRMSDDVRRTVESHAPPR
jgi:4-hydroxy-3-polyprenylbenzoate decarboxylase